MEMVMDITSFLDIHLGTIDGWCDKDKAKKLYETICEIKPSLCVEIGVFGGSSLLPQALAIKHNAKGVIVGIDPWSNSCAIEAMENKANKNWWGNVDLESVYKKFLQKIKLYEVEDFVQVYRNKSSEVVNRFDDNSIDVLHIDGNHCEKISYADAIDYYPKVKIGGYIFFDDINWSENTKDISTEKGLKYLLQFSEEIGVFGKDCLLMKKVK
jgi:predicted O-methyltransferase YrrM